MTKPELIKTIAAKTEMTQKNVDAVLSALSEVVVDTLVNDKTEKIALQNLGTFKVKHVAEKRGVATLGEKKEWVKPAHDEICFKVTRSVKEI